MVTLSSCFWQIDDPSVGPKIPQALEKILQLKESRQEEMNSQLGESASVPGAEADAGLARPLCNPRSSPGRLWSGTGLRKGFAVSTAGPRWEK